MRLRTAVEKFIQESGRANTPSSRVSIRNKLGLLDNRFPRESIDRYDTETLVKFCLMGTPGCPTPSPGTIRGRRSAVSTFFEWATFVNLVPTNPASSLKYAVPIAGHGVRHHSWLTEAEVAGVIHDCPNDLYGRRAKLVLMVGFMMGLRRHEIAGLRWSHFSKDLSRVQLTGKGRKLAELGVPPQLRAELQAWRREALGDVILPWFTTNTFIELVPVWAKAIGPHTVEDIVIAAGVRSGFPELRPHDMRRSFAGILEAKGVPITDISRLLRHANVGITSIYLERNPHKTAALADTFELAL